MHKVGGSVCCTTSSAPLPTLNLQRTSIVQTIPTTSPSAMNMRPSTPYSYSPFGRFRPHSASTRFLAHVGTLVPPATSSLCPDQPPHWPPNWRGWTAASKQDTARNRFHHAGQLISCALLQQPTSLSQLPHTRDDSKKWRIYTQQHWRWPPGSLRKPACSYLDLFQFNSLLSPLSRPPLVSLYLDLVSCRSQLSLRHHGTNFFDPLEPVAAMLLSAPNPILPSCLFPTQDSGGLQAYTMSGHSNCNALREQAQHRRLLQSRA